MNWVVEQSLHEEGYREVTAWGGRYVSYGAVFREASTAVLHDQRFGAVSPEWHEMGNIVRPRVRVVAKHGDASTGEWREGNEAGDSCG